MPMLGPDTVSWRVNREATILAGGGRALLLQVAHPKVAAGVEQHSDYQTDPWGRLYRTLDTTYKITFGDDETSARASRRLRGRHRSVHGTDDAGGSYDAADPELLLWVWATLVETSLTIYERCFTKLPERDRQRYYEEQQRFALACGVPEDGWPASLADFRDYYATTIAAELRVTPSARAVARSIREPSLPARLRPAMAPNTVLAFGLLPARLRAEYGYAWGPQRARALSATLSALRVAGRVTPRAVRHLPVELVASGRLDRVRAHVSRAT